jgi:hypothetical protein
LWADDQLGRVAINGGAGINFHAGRPGQCGTPTSPAYTPICAETAQDLANGIFTAQPEWYAMKLFSAMAGTATVANLRTSTINLRAYSSVAADGTLRVLVDDLAASGGVHTIHLRVPATYGVASASFLTGPSVDATSGVTIQGTVARGDGGFGPAYPTALPDKAGDLVYTQPAGSVALITLTQACTVPKAVGLSLAGAQKVLAQRGCIVGAVNKVKPPKRHKPFLVAAQQYPTGYVARYLTPVKLRLVAPPLPKPKKKKPATRR